MNGTARETEKIYDVLVAGSGPAGICAAVAAARTGAKVLLLERYGSLGGNLTVGHVGPVLGMVGKGTMRDELVKLLGIPDNDMIGRTGKAHDFEKAKQILADFVAAEPNIEVRLQTVVADAVMDGNNLTGVVTAGKEGLQTVHAKAYIDATGDGDLATFAGAEISKGRKEDGLMQPVTMEFTIDNVDESRAVTCIGDVDDVKMNGERFLDFCKKCSEEGLIPKNLAAVRLHPTVYKGQRQVNTTQKNGVDSTVTGDLYPSEKELRDQISILMDFFHKYLPGYENCRLISSGTTLGVRESRRVTGEYVITAEDMIAGRRFDDVVVHRAEFIVDIHNPAGSGQAEDHIQYVKPYDIPYRCFVPLKVENLYTAGRCISGTHRAHASYRVMSICMAMGEAIGTAAALCAKTGATPRTLDVKLLQKTLADRGVDLYG